MHCTQERRHFSPVMLDTNRPYLPVTEQQERPFQVGFILPPHFSMMAFTAAMDALVTANLVKTVPLFDSRTIAMTETMTLCDLGIEIRCDQTVSELQTTGVLPDVLIVCGGYRCSSELDPALNQLLQEADRQGVILGGLWNGAIHLAHAGLLDNTDCALHPENHIFLREHFPKVRITGQAMARNPQRLTSAGPNSALDMMLSLVSETQGQSVTRAVREILNCDQSPEPDQEQAISQIGDDPLLPQKLRDMLQIMAANIEEPISVDELAELVCISRRQVERLFQTHLNTSPGRYYLEQRITHARRLVLQSNDSITNIAIACGFVSTSHFSNCYKEYYGMSPSIAREQAREEKKVA